MHVPSGLNTFYWRDNYCLQMNDSKRFTGRNVSEAKFDFNQLFWFLLTVYFSLKNRWLKHFKVIASRPSCGLCLAKIACVCQAYILTREVFSFSAALSCGDCNFEPKSKPKTEYLNPSTRIVEIYKSAWKTHCAATSPALFLHFTSFVLVK